MKKIAYVIIILFLYSCTTAQQRYPSSSVPVEKQSKLAFLQYEMARNIILHKDYARLSEAFKHLDNARKLLKDDPRIYYMIALAYGLRDDEPKYVAYLNEAIKKDKNFFDAYNALGIYYYKKGKYKKSIETFTKLINNPLYPHGDVAFFNRSRVYLKLKQYKKAENDLRSALMFSGYKGKTYWENLISLQIARKEYNKALSNTTKMEMYLGGSNFTYYSKAACYIKLSMFDKAKAELKKILNSDPEYYVLKQKLLRAINDSNPHK
jgi:tetratricopeptide (TPR) repeat protein